MDKSKQTLPAKENSLFKRILKSYEQKQYKNGLKFAKQILEKFPDHGETLAMKGLTLNCLGRKEEAYTYVKQGLKNNVRSHVCWHVYGLLQRSDKSYEDAIKCYRNALRLEQNNLQILRDLSLLQIQMRDLEGYKETRYKLFELRPTQRASWIGYAMSFHLLKDYDMALRILEEFRKTLHKDKYDYEYSELLLYQNMVMRENGNYEDALEHLDKYQMNICDKVTLQEIRGEILSALNRNDKAAEVYRGLVARNPENREYYYCLENVLCLNIPQKIKMYDEFREKFPRAHVPRRLQLNYASGEEFEKLMDYYLKRGLEKGVTPLFIDIKNLYNDLEKEKIVEKLVLGYLNEIKENGFLQSSENSGDKEPATLLYVYMFLAQHYNHIGDTESALSYLYLALDHTPTLIELYILKGKILKNCGDLVGAHQTLVEAQSLDTADRYVNSKAASYLLNANLVDEAEEMCAKFTREDVSAMENLNEMQCMWFQTQCARSYFRLKQYGNALKKCHEIDRHFTEITEDQFDFHIYCMRKMTLRSYVELLRLEDVLRNHRSYWDAAEVAIKIYLRLYDYPITSEIEENKQEEKNTSQVKKVRPNKKKLKKEQAKIEEAKKKEEKNKQKHKNHHNQNDDMESGKPEALVPSKLERPDDALAEAINFLKPLQLLSPNRIHTHIFAFEIYYRKDKPLIMLQSLKRALVIDDNNADLHTCLIKFLKYFQDKLLSDTSIVKQVIENEMLRFIKTLDPLIINEEFLNKNKNSFPHRLQAARSMFLLDEIQKERALTIATALDSHLTGRTIENLLCALEWLESKEFGASPEEIEHYKLSCHEIYPRAIHFQTAVTNHSPNHR